MNHGQEPDYVPSEEVYTRRETMARTTLTALATTNPPFRL